MKELTSESYEMMMRTARVIWNMGYFVRTEVPLSSYFMGLDTLDRAEITDIDVLGLRWDEDFSLDSVVCECKTGFTTKPIDRTLWLAGVKSYFGARKAFLVCEKGNSIANAVGNKLGVNVLDPPLLERLERTYSIEADDWFGSISDDYYSTRERILKDKNLPLASEIKYIRWGYWIEPPFSQLKRTLWVGKQLADSKMTKKASMWLSFELFILFASSLVSFSAGIYNSRLVDMNPNLSAGLFGGHLSLNERQSIVDSLYRFMNQYLKKYDDSLPFKKLRTLEPEYYQDLADLMDRILRSNEHRLVPRFADFVAFEWLIEEEPLDADILKNRFHGTNTDLLVKLTKNILDFFLKWSKISDEPFQSIYEY